MPLNHDAVGIVTEPRAISWDSTRALLYAVGVGCGTNELQFTTENSSGVAQQVLPTLPVVLPGAAGLMDAIGPFNRAMLLHGAQSVTLHQPLPVAGSATVVGRVVGMYDKGKAAVVVMESAATDSRARRCTPRRCRHSSVVRAAGVATAGQVTLLPSFRHTPPITLFLTQRQPTRRFCIGSTATVIHCIATRLSRLVPVSTGRFCMACARTALPVGRSCMR